MLLSLIYCDSSQCNHGLLNTLKSGGLLPLYGECCAKLRRAHMNGFHIDSVWSYYIQAAVTHCYRRSLISEKDVEKLISRSLALLTNAPCTPHCDYFVAKKFRYRFVECLYKVWKLLPPAVLLWSYPWQWPWPLIEQAWQRGKSIRGNTLLSCVCVHCPVCSVMELKVDCLLYDQNYKHFFPVLQMGLPYIRSTVQYIGWASCSPSFIEMHMQFMLSTHGAVWLGHFDLAAWYMLTLKCNLLTNNFVP